MKAIESVEEFRTVIASEPCVVDFFAQWCGPCKPIGQLLTEMSQKEEYKGLNFLKVNVEEFEDLAQEYNITAMPTIVCIKDSQVKQQVVGAIPPKIKAAVDELLVD